MAKIGWAARSRPARDGIAMASAWILMTVLFQNCGGGFQSSDVASQALSTGAAAADDPIDLGKARGVNAGELLVHGTDAVKLDQIAAAIAASGATWIRVEFQWQSVAPGGLSTADFSQMDAVVGAARAHGLNVLGLIDYSAGYANGGQDQMVPPDATMYAGYAALLAKRYASRGVSHWEIWNEENLATFWNGGADAALYAKMLKEAYPAIKSANPSATVILGGFAPSGDDATNQSPMTYLQALYAAGAMPYFDAVALHPYIYDDESWFTGAVPQLRQIMNQNGDAHKLIWLTETGSPSSGSKTKFTEAFQARIISRILSLHATTAGLGPVLIYDWQDEGPDKANDENNFGLVRLDGSQKPSYAAFLRGP